MRGYVYVLVNSSLPGLVKIGKTTRLPSERVQELSGATGVPTPFVVAYEQQFEDCDAVEAYVHAMLERQGLRPASNREFFAASPTQVIQLLLGVPPQLTKGNSTEAQAQTAFYDTEAASDAEPWEALMQQADDHVHGRNGQLQDYAEAFKLYQDAARLGCAQAYAEMGHLTEWGMGVRENRNAALELYKKSAERGYYRAYFHIMGWYATERHEYNFHASLEKFLALAALANGGISDLDVGVLAWYVEYALMRGWEPKLLPEIRSNLQRIRAHYDEGANDFARGQLTKSRRAASDWVNQHML